MRPRGRAEDVLSPGRPRSRCLRRRRRPRQSLHQTMYSQQVCVCARAPVGGGRCIVASRAWNALCIGRIICKCCACVNGRTQRLAAVSSVSIYVSINIQTVRDESGVAGHLVKSECGGGGGGGNARRWKWPAGKVVDMCVFGGAIIIRHYWTCPIQFVRRKCVPLSDCIAHIRNRGRAHHKNGMTLL